MTGILRSIILSVSTSALLGGIAMTLTQSGALKEIVRLAAGVMVILSLLYPLSNVQLRFPTQWLRSAQKPVVQEVERAKEERKAWMAESSEKEISAYLMTKVREAQIPCTIFIHASMTKEDTVSLDGATVQGVLTAQQAQWVENLLKTECGIPKEMQLYVEK